MGHDVRPGRHAALRAVLVLLLAVTGLACGQITAKADTGPRPAAAAVQSTDTSPGAPSADADADAAVSDATRSDTAFTGTGCSGKQDLETEPPVSARAHLDAAAAAPSVERPVARTARAVPGGPGRPGGPAPPPTVPLFEALSVLRV